MKVLVIVLLFLVSGVIAALLTRAIIRRRSGD
jgi:hypothetical protein